MLARDRAYTTKRRTTQTLWVVASAFYVSAIGGLAVVADATGSTEARWAALVAAIIGVPALLVFLAAKSPWPHVDVVAVALFAAITALVIGLLVWSLIPEPAGFRRGVIMWNRPFWATVGAALVLLAAAGQARLVMTTARGRGGNARAVMASSILVLLCAASSYVFIHSYSTAFMPSAEIVIPSETPAD